MSKKSLRSCLTRCARSRRVRNGALKARWQRRSKGIGFGLLGLFCQLFEADAAFRKRLNDFIALFGIGPRVRKSCADGQGCARFRPRSRCSERPEAACHWDQVRKPDARRSRPGRHHNRIFGAPPSGGSMISGPPSTRLGLLSGQVSVSLTLTVSPSVDFFLGDPYRIAVKSPGRQTSAWRNPCSQ